MEILFRSIETGQELSLSPNGKHLKLNMAKDPVFVDELVYTGPLKLQYEDGRIIILVESLPVLSFV